MAGIQNNSQGIHCIFMESATLLFEKQQHVTFRKITFEKQQGASMISLMEQMFERPQGTNPKRTVSINKFQFEEHLFKLNFGKWKIN